MYVFDRCGVTEGRQCSDIPEPIGRSYEGVTGDAFILIQFMSTQLRCTWPSSVTK